ncbi:hypothetical protein [Sphingobacterium daejeonense]|uniref:hypothetical protein n=1 Tax=Sphingobacterium daejeonense TaxID=371142 RepID=UPI0010C34912|nr:hypothetical protein [Sphingobacterium daejeonense]VTP97312.1 Uncharacterised protein [Sphingobacterium daejeonense]
MKTIQLLILVLILQGCQQPKTKNSTPEIADSTTVKVDTAIFENDTIAIYKIDSSAFLKNKANSIAITDTLVYIEDFAKAKELLKGKVKFGDYDMDSHSVDTLKEGTNISYIVAESGDTLKIESNQDFAYVGFVRYYPTENIVLFEGGHTSDYAIDLKNGSIDVMVVGNPQYIQYSPSKKYRLNGWFPGQECSDYFIQEKIGDNYKVLARMPIHLTEEGFDLCTLKDIFWYSDRELYFRNTYFGFEEDKRLGYFKLILK